MGTKVVKFEDLQQAVDQFVTAASNKYHDINGNPSLAYPCGYLQSMVTNMLMDLPKAKREHYLSILKVN